MYSTTARQAAARVGQARVGRLALQRGEEGLGHRVVPGLALASHGQGDLAVSGERGVGGGGVPLAAAVGVEDHARRGVAGGDRVAQRGSDQLGAQVIGQGEPDDAAGGDVDDGD